MKIHHLLCGVIVLAGSFMVGTPAQAYFTTAQSARMINATTSLFAITYAFGSTDRDIDLPILAGRDISTTSTDSLGYTLLTASGTATSIGSMHGLVLSSAAIKDGRYHIPAGKSATFTFVVFLTTPGAATPTSHKVRVSALPFSITDHGNRYDNHLNPSELQYYTTPASPLKPGKIATVDAGKGVKVTYTTK